MRSPRLSWCTGLMFLVVLASLSVSFSQDGWTSELGMKVGMSAPYAFLQMAGRSFTLLARR